MRRGNVIISPIEENIISNKRFNKDKTPYFNEKAIY